MRPPTRKVVAQLAIFLSVLLFVLFLNRPTWNTKDFAWTTVRYKTSASKLPEARGVCPGTADNKKPTLVVARVAGDVHADGDAQWLYELGVKYHLCLYYTDAQPGPDSINLQVPANRGHEAMAYLTFIIDNYENITQPVVFVHGTRYAWHNDHERYDNSLLLHALDVPKALEPHGYHNLRCDWSLSTCPASTPPQGSLANTMQAAMARWDARAASDAALPRALETIFGDEGAFFGRGKEHVFLGRSDAVRAQCCAQFTVSPDRIRQHSKSEYFALRQWLLDGGKDSYGRHDSRASPSDDRVAGRIMSYVWHILFLPHEEGTINLQRLNQLGCQSAADCYCRLYNRCNLDCPSPEQCRNQYRLPPNLKIPDGWAAAAPHT